MCNNTTNDFGTCEEYYREINRLIKLNGLHGTYMNFWLNAYDDNILPSDAMKEYIKQTGELQ